MPPTLPNGCDTGVAGWEFLIPNSSFLIPNLFMSQGVDRIE
jgi:hypothetical protein